MAVEALRLAWLRAQRTALRHTVSRYADLQPHFNLASTLLLSSYRSLAQIPKCPGFLFFSLPFSAAICLEPPPSQTDVAPSQSYFQSAVTSITSERRSPVSARNQIQTAG